MNVQDGGWMGEWTSFLRDDSALQTSRDSHLLHGAIISLLSPFPIPYTPPSESNHLDPLQPKVQALAHLQISWCGNRQIPKNDGRYKICLTENHSHAFETIQVSIFNKERREFLSCITNISKYKLITLSFYSDI